MTMGSFVAYNCLHEDASLGWMWADFRRGYGGAAGVVMQVREPSSTDSSLGISRRTLLRRGAVVGGVLVWTPPVVITLASPAASAGTPVERVVRSNAQ